MKNAKKVFALMLALALACGSLVACNSSKSATKDETTVEETAEETDEGTTEEAVEEEPAEAVEMTFAWWGAQEANDAFASMINMYMEENPNVTIEGTPYETAAYWDKMATNAAGNSLPEVMMMDYTYIEQYVSKGQLLDLTPYVESGALDVSGIAELNLDGGRVQDGLYGINFVATPVCMQYNKTLLDEAGITVKDNMTTDEFLALAKEVYEKTGYKTDLAYRRPCFMRPYFMALGKDLTTSEGMGMTQEELQEYFEIYELGMEEGWLQDVTVYAERDGSTNQHPLVYGSSVEGRTWNAFYWGNQTTYLQMAVTDDTVLGITTAPSDDPSKSNFMKPGAQLAIPANCSNPDAAVAFINYLINDVDAYSQMGLLYGIPTNTRILDGIADMMTDTEKMVVNFINDVLLPNGAPVYPPEPAGSKEVEGVINTVTDQVMYGELTAAEAAEELYTQGNAILQAQ